MISRFYAPAAAGSKNDVGNNDPELEINEGAKNINDISASNIEHQGNEEKASSHDGNNEADEVVVEAKRRRKSPPVHLRHHKEQDELSLQRPPSSSFNESPEDSKLGKAGLSLKSPLDLESSSREEPPSSPASSSTNKEDSSPPDAAGSIQAALAALQAGQISLNQVLL